MEALDDPFAAVDAVIESLPVGVPLVIDLHAEATSEKKVMLHHVAGRAAALIGTHTHVQTADETLHRGTAYITDVGMTGPSVSVIGIQPQLAVKKQREHVPVQFKVADGPLMLNAVLFTLDDISGLCVDVRRIYE